MSDPTPELICWNRDDRQGEPWDYCGSPADRDALRRWSAEYQSIVQHISDLQQIRNQWQETVTRSFAELQEPMRALRSRYPAITNMEVTRARNAFIRTQLHALLEEIEMLDQFDSRLHDNMRGLRALSETMAALVHGLQMQARGFGPPVLGHMVDLAEDDDPTAPPLPGNITTFPQPK